MSLYDDLGVGPDASQSELKAAHRAGARRHHPDLGGDRADFDPVQRAYDVLSDPESRRRYDRTGAYDQVPPPSEEQEALSVLQAVLTELIGGGADLVRVDLVGAVLAALGARLKAVLAGSLAADVAIGRIAEARGRLSRSGGAQDDPLAALFEHQLREAEALKLRVQRAVRVHSAAMDLIRGYAYRTESGEIAITYSHAPGELNIQLDAPPPAPGA
jgi:curved DNA-binding protein CbpA